MKYGERFERFTDADFVRFVQETLPYLSFETASVFYGSCDKLTREQQRYLAAADRYYLFTKILNRADGINEWVYDRCREVSLEPDGCADLWSRFHYKSSVITFAGSIQEIINDAEITIAIFSADYEIAAVFVEQIKRELEDNSNLKTLYPEVFYSNPRADSPLWRKDRIIVRRRTNPAVPTIEAQSIMQLRTGRHYRLRIYDDMVNETNVTETDTDQRGKVWTQFELSQSLKAHDSSRMQLAGTRYHFADANGIVIERGILKARIYPATHNGRLDGDPVFMTKEDWADVKKKQSGVVAAQMLLNPVEGNANTFTLDWARPYAIRPRLLNIYIMCDPSLGRRRSSDRTAIAVIGIDPNSNRYLIDGYCHRMKLSDRWRAISGLYKKYSLERDKGHVTGIWVGYERYGMQSDTEYFDEQMFIQKIEGLQIDEVSWVREGPQSKVARIGRLEPFFRESNFWLPPYVWHPDHGKCTWRVDHQELGQDAEGEVQGGAKIRYRPYQGASREEAQSIARGEKWRVTEPLRRLDENGDIYDLTRTFFEEFRLHPFAPHDDFLDTMSRVEDMAPRPAMRYESKDLESPSHPDT